MYYGEPLTIMLISIQYKLLLLMSLLAHCRDLRGSFEKIAGKRLILLVLCYVPWGLLVNSKVLLFLWASCLRMQTLSRLTRFKGQASPDKLASIRNVKASESSIFGFTNSMMSLVSRSKTLALCFAAKRKTGWHDVSNQRSEHQKFGKSTSFWAPMLGDHSF